MSLKIIEEQIANFLNSEVPEVLAIRGPWGVGKTYTWNKLLEQAKANNRIALEKYAYVSLFGINSLDALKSTIFSHIISREFIGNEPSVFTWKEGISAALTSQGIKTMWNKRRKLFSQVKSSIPSIQGFQLSSLMGPLGSNGTANRLKAHYC